jgi:hypothetical protein
MGKVLYLSHEFKNVVLLGLYDLTLAEPFLPSTWPSRFYEKVYTSQRMIQDGDWPIVGFEALKDEEKGVARRIVGGEVWLDDQELGTATKEDWAHLPKMLVAGAGLVEKDARTIAIRAKASKAEGQ